MAKPYTFPKIKVITVPAEAGYKPETAKPEEEPMGMILGQEPGSRNEWYVALALMEFKIEFMYQFIVRGGGGLRGTIRLDFLVLNPFAVPVQVYGNYWHGGERKAEDRLQEAFMAQYFGHEVVPIWGSESDSRESAREAVRSKLL